MPTPKNDKTKPMIAAMLAAEADHRGITEDSLDTETIQLCALALRSISNDPLALQAANDLDALSELGEPEIAYLEDLAGRPRAA